MYIVMLRLFLMVILSHSLFSSAMAACSTDIARMKTNAMYKDYGNGTVLDTKTRLVWQKCSMGQTYSSGTCAGTATSYTWDQAMAEAQAANLANMYGYNDWRVPNIKELFSLADLACENPAINEELFPNTPASGFYWSSTLGKPSSLASTNHRAYYISSDNGFFNSTGKNSSTRSLRLVRAGR